MIKVGSKVRIVQGPADHSPYHYDRWPQWFFDAAKDVPAKVISIYNKSCNVEFIRPIVDPTHGSYTQVFGRMLYLFEEIKSEKSSEYED